MSCSIEITDKGVVARDNQPLFDAILNRVDGDVTSAISIYGVTLNDEFKEIFPTPTISDVIDYIEIDNKISSEPLSKDEKKTLLDISLNNSEGDIRSRFIDAFTVDGAFALDKNKLSESKLFTESEMYDIIKGNYQVMQSLYYKLHLETSEIQPINSEYISGLRTGFKSNPDVDQFKSMVRYSGLTTVDEIYDKAVTENDDFVLNNPDINPTILEDVSKKQTLIEYEQDDISGEIKRKEQNNIETEMSNTFDIEEDFSEILGDIVSFVEAPIELLSSNIELTINALKEIETKMINKGIDMRDLSLLAMDKPLSETVDMMDSLYNLLYDATIKSENISDSFDDFISNHRFYFGEITTYKDTVVDKIEKEGVYLHGEFDSNEVDLFVEHGLVKYDKGVYRRLTDTRSTNELKQLVLLTKPYLKSIQDLDKHLAPEIRDLTTETSNVEDVTRLVLFKNVIGSIPDNGTRNPMISKKFNIPSFIKSIYKEMLKNETLYDLLYVSNRGVEARYGISDYTDNLLKNELSETMYTNLKNYATVSGNKSLSYLANPEVTSDTNDPDHLRNYYANNMRELDIYSKDYVKDGDVVYTNTNDDFIKIDNNLYEKMADSVYGKVEVDARYMNYNLLKPNLSYDNDYRIDQGSPKEVKEKIKNSNAENDSVEFC